MKYGILEYEQAVSLLLASIPALSVTAARLACIPLVRKWLGQHSDILQEALLLAWRKGFRSGPGAYSWTTHLCHVARRQILWEANQRSRRLLGTDYRREYPSEPVCPRRDPVDSRLDADTILAGLNTRDRRILLREGALEEVAQESGEPFSVVKGRSSSLIRKLKKQWNKEAVDG